MEITREDLAAALAAAKVVVDLGDDGTGADSTGRDSKGCYAIGTIRYPESLAADVLRAAGPELPGPNCPSCLRGDNGGGYPCCCPVPCGARYCQHAPEPAPAASAGADAELAVIAAALTGLDRFGWEHGDTSAPAWRVLSYLAHRYGYVLATED